MNICKLTLEEYIADMHDQINKFKLEWDRNVKEGNKSYPNELTISEWDEQFITFVAVN